MEVNRDVTRRDILYGVLKRMDEVIDSISNTVSTKDFLVRDIIYDLDRLEEAKLAWKRPNWLLWRCWKTCSRKRVRIKKTR